MATDKAEAEKLAAESKPLSAQAHEIRQAHLKSAIPQIDAISKERFKWTPQANLFKPVYTAGTTTRVQNITIEALGDSKHTEALLAGLNTASLTTMVAQ
jgi:hypothetical protein